MLIIPIIVLVVGTCSAIALSRIALGKHYPIDVLAGLLFGVLITALLGL
jgi:membrane-associated phospholipid phosphatase